MLYYGWYIPNTHSSEESQSNWMIEKKKEKKHFNQFNFECNWLNGMFNV